MSKTQPKPKPKPHNGNGGHARALPAPHTRALPALVPQPPPAPVLVREQSRNSAITRVKARAKAEVQELKDALEKKETKVSHVVAGGAGAVGCTLSSVFIVGKGWLSPAWTSALMTAAGIGAAVAGHYYEQPLLLWGGMGWTFAGGAHATMAGAVAWRRYQSHKDQPRNAQVDGESDIGKRLRLSEERARELELELTRARQRLNPETELAAA